jgi:hypothetical protein
MVQRASHVCMAYLLQASMPRIKVDSELAPEHRVISAFGRLADPYVCDNR